MRAFASIFGGIVAVSLLCICISQGQVPAHSETVPNVALAATLSPRVEAPKAKQAFCKCGANCECGIDCRCNELSTDAGRLSAAAKRAVADGKPLLIWVGQTCACDREMSDFVHVHLGEYDGIRGKETSQEVIVGKPDGKGGFTVAARIAGCPNDVPTLARQSLAPPFVKASACDGGFCPLGGCANGACALGGNCPFGQ